MPKINITWFEQYPTGTVGTDDPGYCAVRAETYGRQFLFYCNSDGSNIRRISSRPCPSDRGFRAYSRANEKKQRAAIERALKEYLAQRTAAVQPGSW